MSQSYDPTKPQSGVTTFGQLYQIIRDHIAAASSNFSGTAFPANPGAGQPCYRTDRLTSGGVPKLYIYTALPSFGESGWVEVSANSVVGEEIVNARGTKPTLDQRLDVALNEDGTLKASTTLNPSQWFLPSLTFTYLSTTSFKVNGDQTDIYKATRRLKINLGASTVYSEVVSASYSAPDTTIQVLDAVIDATLVSVEHSLFLPATRATDGGKSALSPKMLGHSRIEYAPDTGAANAYVVTLDPAPTAYFNGMLVIFKAANANTGASTINVNGLGVKTIKKNGNVDLVLGDISVGQIMVIVYNGEDFSVISPFAENSVSVSILPSGDLGAMSSIIHPLFPWSSPVKLANPATLPTGDGRSTAWSPNGEFLVVSHATSPYVTIYQRSGSTFIKLTDPTLPTGTGRGPTWSPSGEFLAVSHLTSPFVTIYQRSGSTFTKLANPATLPTGNGTGAAWSPNGEFLAVSHFTSPFVTIYQRSGSTFTKLANPATLPTGDGAGIAWSPNGEFLAVAHNGSPYVTIYQRSGNTFTKLANPLTLPASTAQNLAWSPSGKFLAVAHTSSPYVTIYQRSGNTFTKLANPATLPAGNGLGIAWSPKGDFLAVTHAVSPFITIYERSGTTFTKLTNPATLPTGDGMNSAWSPNGEFLSVTHLASPFVTIYQTTSDMPEFGSMRIVGVGREGI